MGKARRLVRTTPTTQLIDDFSLGIHGGQTDSGLPVKHARLADNAIFDKRLRGVGGRPGYRDVVVDTLSAAGHSLMAYYGPSTTRYFVGYGSAIAEIIDGGTYTNQSLPVSPSSSRWSSVDLNGALIATQEGGANLPIAFNGTDWLSIQFPTPTTPTFNLDSAGGSVDAGAHLWRIRHRFKNGSSVASAATASHTVAGPNFTVNLNITASARSDYLGWTVERTKAGDVGTDALWYWVADGTAATYADTASDAALSSRIGAEPGVHAAPPHLEGVIAFRNRLIGWSTTTIYVSQEVADLAEASGIYNFNALSQFAPEADDGDVIKQCIVAGDRVVIFKRSSVHVLEGFDLTNFVRRRLPGNVGCASTRGACVVGSTVYWYGGDQQFYYLRGDQPTPIGQAAMRHYFEQMDTAYDGDVVCWEHERGRYFAVACRFVNEAQNNHVLAYRTEFRQWHHWKDLRISDVLIPKKIGGFASAKMLFTDPKSVSVPTGSTLDASNPSFHVWADGRSGVTQYFVAKVSAAGASLWSPADGVQVSAGNVSPTIQFAASIPDNAGGLIVAYVEGTTTATGQVVLQRLSTGGTKQWGVSGLMVSDPTGTTSRKDDVAIVSDGAGGCIVAWLESAPGGGAAPGIRIQRVNASGVIQWAANGIFIVATGADRRSLKARPTADGGAYLAWNNLTAGRTEALRITSAGAAHAGWGATPKFAASFVGSPCLADDAAGGLWVGGGQKVVRFAAADGTNPFPPKDLLASTTFTLQGGIRAIVPDGAGGIIAIYWTFESAGSLHHVQGQRVDATGAFLWAVAGVDLHTATTSSLNFSPRAVQDGVGGAIAVWQTSSPGPPFVLNAQRINGAGARQWGTEGATWRNLTVSGEINNSIFTVCIDGGNGVVVMWQDDRPGTGNLNNIYVQRINSLGAEQWAADGVQLCAATGTQTPFDSEFTATPTGDYPAAGPAGYHVWAGLEGRMDAVKVDGSGGSTIAWLLELPDTDDGLDDIDKDYDAVRLLVKNGSAQLNVGFVVDQGAISVAVPLSVSSSGARWGSTADGAKADTLIWGQGRWSGGRVSEFIAPLPGGTIGKTGRVVLTADLDDELLLSTIAIDYEALPDRPYARS